MFTHLECPSSFIETDVVCMSTHILISYSLVRKYRVDFHKAKINVKFYTFKNVYQFKLQFQVIQINLMRYNQHSLHILINPNQSDIVLVSVLKAPLFAEGLPF
jgi:hypothetical protein